MPETITPMQEDRELLDKLDYFEWLHCDGRPNPDALHLIAIHRIEAERKALEGLLTNCIGLQSNGGNGGPSFVKVSFAKPGDQNALYSALSRSLPSRPWLMPRRAATWC